MKDPHAARKMLALLAACAAALVVVDQVRVFRLARTRLDGEIASAESDLERSRVAERRREELRAETLRLEEDVARLRRLLPEAVDVDSFVAALGEGAATEGVGVVENGVRTVRKDDLVETFVSVTFFGPLEKTRRVATSADFPPLHSFVEESSSASHLFGHFEVSAWPAATSKPERRVSPADPWLWPLTEGLASRREALARLQGQLRPVRPLLAEVERFDALKSSCLRLAERVDRR